jgi:putative flavoprotein involved in K+ transport
MSAQTTNLDVIVIGGGQAGLSVGHHLRRRNLRFLILDASARIGDAWRHRWDSLRLFTPARYSSLDGMRLAAPGDAFITKDEMADYLEAYAARFELPVLSSVRVDRLSRRGGRYVVEADGREFEAPQVVVAIGTYQQPTVPAFAADLSPTIRQLHSHDYRNPAQLKPGDVLLVGAGNSGSELAMELAKSRRVYMSGRSTGEIPFRIGGFLGRTLLVRLVLRFIFHRVLTIATPIGRAARPKLIVGGGPLIRVKARDLAAAGVVRTGRTVGAADGRPRLEDGRVLDVTNVIWCTGFNPGFTWLDLPILDAHDGPRHLGGVVPEAPGLYFVGLHFLYSLSSEMIHGVGRDADRIAGLVAARAARQRSGRESAQFTAPIARPGRSPGRNEAPTRFGNGS